MLSRYVDYDTPRLTPEQQREQTIRSYRQRIASLKEQLRIAEMQLAEIESKEPRDA